MLIGLDMDGVITDWDDGLDSRTLSIPELADFPRQPERGWNHFPDADPRHKQLVYEILEHPEFYRDLKPIEGAIDAVNHMRAQGHDVIFVSSPWESNPMGYQAKADWLNEHLGGWARKNLYLGADKTLVHCDVLVDDKPVMKGRLLEPDAPRRPSWERIWFTQPYNEGLAGCRIDSWEPGTWEDLLYGHEGGTF